MHSNMDATKNANDNKPKKQVTFQEFVKVNPNAVAKSEKTTNKMSPTECQLDITSNVPIPVRSEGVPEIETSTPNEGIELHANLRCLDEHRKSLWKKIEDMVVDTEAVYKSRVSTVKVEEKKLIDIIQETSKNTIAALDKNREILLEAIGQKLQEFDSLSKICEEDINTLNVMQTRLKEALDRVGFNA